MRAILLFVVTLLMGIFLLATPYAGAARGGEIPSPDEIVQIERQLIESRKALRSGRVVVRTRLTVFEQDPTLVNSETKRSSKNNSHFSPAATYHGYERICVKTRSCFWTTAKYVTYLQGDNIRCDREKFIEGKEIHDQLVFTDNAYIAARELSPTVMLRGPKRGPPDSQELPDPRRLGFVLWYYDTMNAFGYESVMLLPGRDRFNIEAGAGADGPLWKVSFCAPGKRVKSIEYEYWLARNKGNLPVYVAMRYGEGKNATLRSIRSNVKKFGQNNVWFPSEVVLRFENTRQNKVTAEQIVTVEDAVFGETVPDETFTLAALNLPKGRAVNADGKLLTWDGNRLTRDTAGTARQEDEPTRATRPWLLLSSSVILAFLAAVFFWRRIRRRPVA